MNVFRTPALKFLGLSAGKFVEMKESGPSLLTFFKPIPQNTSDVASEIKAEKTADEAPVQSEIEEDNNVGRRNSNLKISDYRDSFFCRYFLGKRLRVATPVGSENENKKIELQADISENPIPSTSKSEPENVDNLVPSTSRESDLYSIQICESSETDGGSVEEGNSRSDATDMTEVCAECNQQIPLVAFLEHLDHHVACKLQKELNSAPASRVVDVPQNSKTRNDNSMKVSRKPTREKRKYTSAKARDSPAKQRITMYSYFKPQVKNADNE